MTAQLANYDLLYNTPPPLKFTIPIPLRRRRQLFCKLLNDRGVTTYKGKWVVVVMKASHHPWRVDYFRGIRGRYPNVPIWQKDYIYQVLTPKQIDGVLREDPHLERYFIEHWLETQHG
jgi:hypothetical protein